MPSVPEIPDVTPAVRPHAKFPGGTFIFRVKNGYSHNGTAAKDTLTTRFRICGKLRT